MQLVPESVLSYFSTTEIVRITVLAESLTCITYLVELEGFSYVLKRYYPGTAYSAVPVNEEASQFLFLSGFEQLCKLLLASDQSTNYEDVDGSIWTAREFIDADATFNWIECTWSSMHCREVGELLAHLHARAIYVEHDLELLQVNTSILSRTKITYDLLLTKTEDAIESLLMTEERAFFEGYASVIKDKVQALISLLSEGSGNPSLLGTAENWMLSETVLNHGDLHPGNVLFKDGKAVAIIDFDYANFNTPAIELGYALFMFAVKKKVGNFAGGESVMSSEFAKAFLDSYFNTLKRIENVRDYSFESIFALLEPRVKLASLYTFFWAAQSIEQIFTKISCDAQEDNPSIGDSLTREPGSKSGFSNLFDEKASSIDSTETSRAVDNSSDGSDFRLNELVEIARFSLAYFFES